VAASKLSASGSMAKNENQSSYHGESSVAAAKISGGGNISGEHGSNKAKQ